MSRKTVMEADPQGVAQFLIDHPDEWFMVAHGTVADRHVLSQSALRVRQHRYSGFQKALAESGMPEGMWEVTVRTDPDVERDDPKAVTMYARWRTPDLGS